MALHLEWLTEFCQLAGVDDDNDKDTSLAGVHGDDTSLAGVPIPPITTNDNNHSGEESDHNSIDPNKVDKNSSKASICSTRSHIPVHSMTREPPQHPPDEEDLDDIELPEPSSHTMLIQESFCPTI